MGFRRRSLVMELGPKTIKQAADVLKASLNELNDLGHPTQKAVDSAMYVLDQVHGKARQSVEVDLTGDIAIKLDK